ncbi:unnamed protein product [Phaedon cochleariae]|uniref:aralkylamine N-acetyltransferase n=1 Tax=Phaedon cochleariae TaxID=80249 RepID=A0A9N9X1F8_PHACE|nr:unnamed protein product [Phaedon cochleariae]
MTSESQNYILRLATPEDKGGILRLLREFFCKDEPTCDSLKIVSAENPVNHALEDYCMKYFDDGVTVVAFHNENIIAMCLAGITERGKLDNFHCSDEMFLKTATFLGYVDQQADSFKQFPECDKALVINVVTVDTLYRGRGLASRLIQKTIELGKERGCGFVTAQCTNHFSALAMKKLGFQLHYSLDYADYKVDGKVVFRTKPPHEAVTVYSKKI